MSSASERLKARVDTIEKVQTEGIDWLATEIKSLFSNDSVIGEAVESHDTTIAAIRALLVSKGILTDEEIDAKAKEINTIREAAAENLKKTEELMKMKTAAENAGKEGHPTEAFIFGG